MVSRLDTLFELTTTDEHCPCLRSGNTECIQGVNGFCVSGTIIFRDWEPQGTYIRAIRLYNTSSQLQRMLYEVPKNSAFSMPLPVPLKIPIKTGVNIPIMFMPTLKKNYHDRVIICIKGKARFNVKIRAFAHKQSLMFPLEFTAGLCAVAHTIKKSFPLQNVSEVTVEFSWTYQEPITVHPKSGSLQSGEKCVIEVSFSPLKAAYYEVIAVCHYGPDLKSSEYTVIKARAIFPYLYVETSTCCQVDGFFLDLGVVPFGCPAKKTLTVVNPLSVETRFSIHRPASLNCTNRTCFSFSKTSGTVTPGNSTSLQVTYRPQIPAYTDSDFWVLFIPGGLSEKKIQLRGHCTGPVIQFSETTIDFKEVERGTKCHRTLKITNNSPVDTSYQFMLDNSESAFAVQPFSGILSGHSTRSIRITFQPQYPITHYRRLACVIHMHDPIFFDLLGTAFSSDVHPLWLEAKHVEIFWKQAMAGQFFFEDRAQVLDTNISRTQPTAKDEYMFDGYHSDFTVVPSPASLDQHHVEFGQCPRLGNIPNKIVSVTNHTYFEVTVSWMGDPTHVFSIKPPISEIAPHRTGVYQVVFKPTATNYAYQSELEAYVHCCGKGIEPLNPGGRIWPPWYLVLKATGHTFLLEREIPMSQFTVSSREITLQASVVRTFTMTTFVFTNKQTSIPVMYNLKANMEGVVIKPQKGLIREPHQIFMAAIVAKTPGPINVRIKIETNQDSTSERDLILEGCCATPCITIENEAGIYFKPTCVGMMTERRFGVRNLSPVLVRYSWVLKPQYGSVIAVEPTSSIIHPNEIQYTTWTFYPMATGRYTFTVVLLSQPADQFDPRFTHRQEIFATGEGASGWVTSDPAEIKTGALIVGTSKIVKLTLRNQGPCHLNLVVEMEQLLDGVRFRPGTGLAAKQSIEFSDIGHAAPERRLQLPPQCQKPMPFRLLPRQNGQYKFHVYYRLQTSGHDGKREELGNRILICSISVQGVYPLLQFKDARFLGSGCQIRKQVVWQLLSLHKLNECLRAEPVFDMMSAALDESVFPLIDSMDLHPRNKHTIDFNLPPAPARDATCTVVMKIVNTGMVTVNWIIYFPNDRKVDVESWAQSGIFEDSELDHLRIMEDRLFQVEPHKGVLEPQAFQLLTITYTHAYPSRNIFPISIKCQGGMEVKINIIGTTFPSDIPKIYMPFLTYTFPSVTVGANEGTVVQYSVANFSSMTLKLKIDPMKLRRLQKTHFNHVVLDCLTRHVGIPPNDLLTTLWKFWPLEARQYEVDVPFKFDGDPKMRTVTFLARGTSEPHDWGESLKPEMVVPSQQVVLSHERLILGNVPACCQVTRIFFMNNTTTTRIKFDWIIPYKLLRQRIIVEPKTGKLNPHQTIMCRLIVSTGHSPAIYNLNIYVEISLWKSQSTQSRGSKMRRFSSVIGGIFPSNQSSNSTTGTGSSTKLHRVVSRMPSANEPYPAPFIFYVHLELVAETYLLVDFWNMFPDDIGKFFVNRAQIKLAEDDKPKSVRKSIFQMDVDTEAREAVEDMMNVLIFNALSDPDFEKSVYFICNDPLPYFEQFRKHDPRKRRKKSIHMLNPHESKRPSVVMRDRPSRRSSVTAPPPEIDDDKSLTEMRTHPEGIMVLEYVLDMLLYNILDEAQRGEFSLTARARGPSTTTGHAPILRTDEI